MTTRPITKAIHDFLSALEVAHPGATSGATLQLRTPLYLALRDELGSAPQPVGHLHFWGGVLEVRDAGTTPRAEHKPGFNPSQCILSAGHQGDCFTPENLEERIKESRRLDAGS